MDPSFVEKITGIRRHIHAHPEIGFKEYETQKLIRDTLLEAGVPEASIRVSAGTGLVVDIDGSGPVREDDSKKRVVGIRADMDCLPITEASGVAYSSTKPGLAHSCGHDGHTASTLGTALLIHSRRDRMPSNLTVRFLFQPAEEGPDPGGAIIMLKDEWLMEDMEAVYGYHNNNLLPLGAIWVQPGVASAHCCDVIITVHGKGGHASMPHLAKDPLLAAAAIVISLQTVVSRNISAHSAGVLSICCFQSGTTTNVIPDSAVLKGTLRDFDPSVAATLKRRVEEVSNGVAAAHGVSVTVMLEDRYPCIINAPGPTTLMNELCDSLFGPVNTLKAIAPIAGAEDFSYLAQKVPGCYVHIGGGTESCACRTCHERGYNFNDDVSPIAMALWIRVVEKQFGCVLFPEPDLFPSLPEVESSALEAFVAVLKA